LRLGPKNQAETESECPVESPAITSSPELPMERLERLETENRRLQETIRRLEGMAYRDPLTELHNRRYFDERLREELARSRRDQSPLSVLAVDLDGFKLINDAHGHAEGDRVLQWVASFLNRHLRASDVCCRMGGDEFVVLLPGLTEAGAAALASRLKLAARDEKAPVGFSVGGAMASGAEPAEQFLARADRALYFDKGSSSRKPLAVPRLVIPAVEAERRLQTPWVKVRRTG
jgi:diguanylate cyclase (GGDEF)-like protein